LSRRVVGRRGGGVGPSACGAAGRFRDHICEKIDSAEGREHMPIDDHDGSEHDDCLVGICFLGPALGKEAWVMEGWGGQGSDAGGARQDRRLMIAIIKRARQHQSP